MGERGFVLTTKVISDPHLAREKKLEWVEGLRRAGGVLPLMRLLTQRHIDPTISSASALSLLRLSKSQAFLEEIESFPEVKDLIPSAAGVHQWGWPFRRPSTSGGRQLMMYLAMSASRQAIVPDTMTQEVTEVDSRLTYLTDGLRREGKQPTLLARHSSNLVMLSVLRSVWLKSQDRRWLRWIRWVSSDNVTAAFWLIGFPIPLWSLLSFSLGRFGVSSLGLIWPVSALFSALVFLTGLALFRDERNARHFLLGLILGPAVLLVFLFSESRVFTWIFNTIGTAGLIALSVYGASNSIIKIYFVLAFLSQTFAFMRMVPVRATLPIVANNKTLELCKELSIEG
jgi:hypothetical protein